MRERGDSERTRGAGHHRVVELDPPLTTPSIRDYAPDRSADDGGCVYRHRQEPQPQRIAGGLGEIDPERHGLHPRADRGHER